MKRSKIIIFSCILISLLSFFTISSASAEPELGGGRISLIQGQALIQTKDGGEWTEASVNFPITDGDRILTERDGRVELQLKNGTFIRIGEESQIDIIALNFDQRREFFHLNLLEGKIYVNHRPNTRIDTFFYIDLPYGVLTAYEPSRFRIDLTPHEGKISVLEGSVEFKRDGRPIILARGKTLILREGDYTEVSQLYGWDEWDQWNEARDNKLLSRRYAQRYLPPELEPWEYEIESNGRWIYTTEYRYVWVPTVVVGWTPFRHGYWTWRRGIYCWVPYESWGWFPFHYGRWVYIHAHGWVWVPPFRHAVFWHPGAVGWFIGPSYVSWVPLAPGEIYYGYGYYGPHSVNITRVNINIQKNVYINARIKDAVVTVPKDSFCRRNPVRIAQVENPFLRPAKVSGPPREKPVILDRIRKPSRPIKEFAEKIQSERRPSPREWRRDTPSLEQPYRQTKSLQENLEKRNQAPIPMRKGGEVENLPPVRDSREDSVRNQFERRETPNQQTYPIQGSIEKGNSLTFPTKDKVRVETTAPVREVVKNKGMPVNPPNQVQNLPQEGPSLPKGRPFSTPDSRGQSVQQHRGIGGKRDL